MKYSPSTQFFLHKCWPGLSLPLESYLLLYTCAAELSFSLSLLLSKQTLNNDTCILFSLQREPKGREAGVWGSKGNKDWGSRASLPLFPIKGGVGEVSESGSQVDRWWCFLFIDRHAHIQPTTHGWSACWWSLFPCHLPSSGTKI